MLTKCDLHLPIFAHWWRHGKGLREAFFSNQPEGLFCAFALIIENTETLKRAITNFPKEVLLFNRAQTFCLAQKLPLLSPYHHSLESSFLHGFFAIYT